jgi:hypothetical protein
LWAKIVEQYEPKCRCHLCSAAQYSPNQPPSRGVLFQCLYIILTHALQIDNPNNTAHFPIST